MAGKFILYDLPSNGRRACWSLNPWKTRLALNYKSIDYKTERLEYPDVAPRLSATGLPPNKKGIPYTIPTIKLPGGQHLQDSAKIAAALESLYPSPSPPLHLSHPKTARVAAAVQKLHVALHPLTLPKVPGLLNPISASYYREARRRGFGKSLEDLEREWGGAAWENAQGAIEELRGLLEDDGGPFFLGREPGYADFVFVAALRFMERVYGEGFEGVLRGDESGGFGRLYEACAGWLERDDR
ncbi:hypothetical protein BDV97DRAFT_374790 [Delphinella strobiligena]|nr:hypothetical protein BDV97DRAFT_374790 [Delphinella strobiligena]